MDSLKCVCSEPPCCPGAILDLLSIHDNLFGTSYCRPFVAVYWEKVFLSLNGLLSEWYLLGIRTISVWLQAFVKVFICWENTESLIGFRPLLQRAICWEHLKLVESDWLQALVRVCYLSKTLWASDCLWAIVRVCYLLRVLPVWLASGPCQSVLFVENAFSLFDFRPLPECVICWDAFEFLTSFGPISECYLLGMLRVFEWLWALVRVLFVGKVSSLWLSIDLCHNVLFFESVFGLWLASSLSRVCYLLTRWVSDWLQASSEYIF